MRASPAIASGKRFRWSRKARRRSYWRWRMPEPSPPELLAVANARTFGVNFSTRKEEYISCWFRAAQASVTRGELRLEVGDFGVPALYVRPDESGMWLAN